MEYIQNKIYHSSDISPTIKSWKSGNKTIVFTNGVFDILHIGHITYLAEAFELGDKLVIGLNADASVKRLKGENRPINNQDNRAKLLAALFFVDAVVVFDEDTPKELITIILPDVLVKGADYSIENIVGASEVLANGGSVKTIDFVNGHSSTSLIEKMRAV
ncbi:D-glycero-beta-D-manno-heptose 1-phosphate adenylyltransferase [Mucilaginibacter sp. ZT4R22]|uniref:D-glycero-beta-D-manno-heptose 1-phosphate adenylyltransferase n=2 Tax=Mucilaginibacter pankratovii TaxID=2772110 RepID=A0ABR7WNX0_9SPHI|nr:D-glycero-beta-D-manno-heptose 1-phosphate adenylyltransferase [Mucilaginibacter pankratovii]